MTKALSLWAKFLQLKPLADTGSVTAIRCGIGNLHLLARGDQGEPILFLACEPRPSPRSDIRLKHVGVQFDRQFEVDNECDVSTQVGSYCRITCDSCIPRLHQYFVELMAATAEAHSGVLSPHVADELIDGLLELFRKLAPAPDGSVVGLWGELLLIHLAALPEQFVDAWHIRTTDGFDFAFPDKRIEVKTTESPSREHDFSLRQVRPARPTDFLASIKLSRSSAGFSVLDLVRLITVRLDAQRQGKLWRLVIETLGDDPEGEHSFDLVSASESLVFVNTIDVPAPHVSENAAPYVTNIRFRSNINEICSNLSLERSLIMGKS